MTNIIYNPIRTLDVTILEKELEFRTNLISKINPKFDCLYKDTPGLFKLVTEEEFEEQMKFKQ